MEVLNYLFFFTVAECKEKWRNLRSVYVRRLKPLPSGSGAKSQKPYYLAEAMSFTLPYIKTVGKPEGNVPEEEIPSNSQQSPIIINNDCYWIVLILDHRLEFQ